MGKLTYIASLISTILVIAVSGYLAYDFSRSCGDYLKLAGDAPNVEKADEFLGQALEYIEENNLTSGDSAILFVKQPTNNLKIWYGQIKGAKATTESILKRKAASADSVTQLEQDNALMKIREVVLDSSSSGTSVTTPAWISLYPNQRAMAAWWILSVVFLFIGWVAKE